MKTNLAQAFSSRVGHNSSGWTDCKPTSLSLLTGRRSSIHTSTQRPLCHKAHLSTPVTWQYTPQSFYQHVPVYSHSLDVVTQYYIVRLFCPSHMDFGPKCNDRVALQSISKVKFRRRNRFPVNMVINKGTSLQSYRHCNKYRQPNTTPWYKSIQRRKPRCNKKTDIPSPNDWSRGTRTSSNDLLPATAEMAVANLLPPTRTLNHNNTNGSNYI